MEKIINIHIEKLPEGVYLATSKDIPDFGRDPGKSREEMENAGSRFCRLGDVTRRNSDPFAVYPELRLRQLARRINGKGARTAGWLCPDNSGITEETSTIADYSLSLHYALPR